MDGRFRPLDRAAVFHFKLKGSGRIDRILAGYAPVIFDFEKTKQTTLETISTLAHMAHYVLADLTDAKSVLQELQAIVPSCPTVAVQPLLLQSQEEPGMFDFFRRFRNVAKPVRYQDKTALLAMLDGTIATVEAKVSELNQPAAGF